MKKVLFVALLAGSLMLGACGQKTSTNDVRSYEKVNFSESYLYDAPTEFEYGDIFGEASEAYSGNSGRSEAIFDEKGTGYDSATGMQDESQLYNTESEKLIRTVRMCLQTKEFDALLTLLEERLTGAGGYVQSTQIYGNAVDAKGYRSANLVYRIPQSNLDAFVSGVGENATVVYKTEDAENVTLQYADTESRVKALQIEQERFLALLEQAEDVDSIITIEQHLTELRYEIEAYASKLRLYDNKVNYSTVTLEIEEVNRVTPVEENPTLLTRMKEGFVETVYDLQDSAANFLIWLVTNVLYLIIWAVIIAAIVVVVRKLVRKTKKTVMRKNSEPVGTVPGQNDEEQYDRMDIEK